MGAVRKPTYLGCAVQSGILGSASAIRRTNEMPMTAPTVFVTTSMKLEKRPAMKSSCTPSMQTETSRPNTESCHHDLAGSAIADRIPNGINKATLAEASTK